MPSVRLGPILRVTRRPLACHLPYHVSRPALSVRTSSEPVPYDRRAIDLAPSWEVSGSRDPMRPPGLLDDIGRPAPGRRSVRSLAACLPPGVELFGFESNVASEPYARDPPGTRLGSHPRHGDVEQLCCLFGVQERCHILRLGASGPTPISPPSSGGEQISSSCHARLSTRPDFVCVSPAAALPFFPGRPSLSSQLFVASLSTGDLRFVPVATRSRFPLALIL